MAGKIALVEGPGRDLETHVGTHVGTHAGTPISISSYN